MHKKPKYINKGTTSTDFNATCTKLIVKFPVHLSWFCIDRRCWKCRHCTWLWGMCTYCVFVLLGWASRLNKLNNQPLKLNLFNHPWQKLARLNFSACLHCSARGRVGFASHSPLYSLHPRPNQPQRGLLQVLWTGKEDHDFVVSTCLDGMCNYDILWEQMKTSKPTRLALFNDVVSAVFYSPAVIRHHL